MTKQKRVEFIFQRYDNKRFGKKGPDAHLIECKKSAERKTSRGTGIYKIYIPWQEARVPGPQSTAYYSTYDVTYTVYNHDIDLLGGGAQVMKS